VSEGIHLLESTNDMTDVQIAVAYIKSELDNINMHTFIDHGHFCESDL
jgi:hypothetical protein